MIVVGDKLSLASFHAYIDEQLSEEQYQQVEDLLDLDSEKVEFLHHSQVINERLHEYFDVMLDDLVPEHIIELLHAPTPKPFPAPDFAQAANHQAQPFQALNISEQEFKDIDLLDDEPGNVPQALFDPKAQYEGLVDNGQGSDMDIDGMDFSELEQMAADAIPQDNPFASGRLQPTQWQTPDTETTSAAPQLGYELDGYDHTDMTLTQSDAEIQQLEQEIAALEAEARFDAEPGMPQQTYPVQEQVPAADLEQDILASDDLLQQEPSALQQEPSAFEQEPSALQQEPSVVLQDMPASEQDVRPESEAATGQHNELAPEQQDIAEQQVATAVPPAMPQDVSEEAVPPMLTSAVETQAYDTEPSVEQSEVPLVDEVVPQVAEHDTQSDALAPQQTFAQETAVTDNSPQMTTAETDVTPDVQDEPENVDVADLSGYGADPQETDIAQKIRRSVQEELEEIDSWDIDTKPLSLQSSAEPVRDYGPDPLDELSEELDDIDIDDISFDAIYDEPSAPAPKADSQPAAKADDKQEPQVAAYSHNASAPETQLEAAADTSGMGDADSGVQNVPEATHSSVAQQFDARSQSHLGFGEQDPFGEQPDARSQEPSNLIAGIKQKLAAFSTGFRAGADAPAREAGGIRTVDGAASTATDSPNDDTVSLSPELMAAAMESKAQESGGAQEAYRDYTEYKDTDYSSNSESSLAQVPGVGDHQSVPAGQLPLAPSRATPPWLLQARNQVQNKMALVTRQISRYVPDSVRWRGGNDLAIRPLWLWLGVVVVGLLGWLMGYGTDSGRGAELQRMAIDAHILYVEKSKTPQQTDQGLLESQFVPWLKEQLNNGTRRADVSSLKFSRSASIVSPVMDQFFSVDIYAGKNGDKLSVVTAYSETAQAEQGVKCQVPERVDAICHWADKHANYYVVANFSLVRVRQFAQTVRNQM